MPHISLVVNEGLTPTPAANSGPVFGWPSVLILDQILPVEFLRGGGGVGRNLVAVTGWSAAELFQTVVDLGGRRWTTSVASSSSLGGPRPSDVAGRRRWALTLPDGSILGRKKRRLGSLDGSGGPCEQLLERCRRGAGAKSVEKLLLSVTELPSWRCRVDSPASDDSGVKFSATIAPQYLPIFLLHHYFWFPYFMSVFVKLLQ